MTTTTDIDDNVVTARFGTGDDAPAVLPPLLLDPPEVSPPPFDQLWKQLRSDEEEKPADDQEPGRVVTVFSPKGGCGTSVVATNLALLLAEDGRRRVCLVDLDVEFGDVSIMTGLPPTRSLIDAAGQNPKLSETLDSVLTPWRTGVDCLLAPVDPSAAERIGPKLVGALLETLRLRYEYVVVDTPSHLAEHILDTIDIADHQVLVTTPQLPALKSLRLVLDTLQLLGYAPSRRSVLVNQYDGRGLAVSEIESAIAHPVAATIPLDAGVAGSVDAGAPLATGRADHPVVAALTAFAVDVITHEPVAGRRRGLRRRARKS